jgi:vesicle transport through interaction with t-SNAREs protein 1
MERASLMEGHSRRDGEDLDLEAGLEDDQRASLMNATRRLREGSNRILESRRNIAQTETIGAGILADLQSQRATITRARDNLGGVDEGLNQSSGILSAMNRRALANKIVLYAVGLFFALLCLWMIVRKFVAPHHAV